MKEKMLSIFIVTIRYTVKYITYNKFDSRSIKRIDRMRSRSLPVSYLRPTIPQ